MEDSTTLSMGLWHSLVQHLDSQLPTPVIQDLSLLDSLLESVRSLAPGLGRSQFVQVSQLVQLLIH